MCVCVCPVVRDVGKRSVDTWILSTTLFSNRFRTIFARVPVIKQCHFGMHGRHFVFKLYTDMAMLVTQFCAPCRITLLYSPINEKKKAFFNLRGDTIASTDADGVVVLWDVRMVRERCRAGAERAGHPANRGSFDPSGQYVAVGSDDQSVKMFRPFVLFVKTLICGFRFFLDTRQRTCLLCMNSVDTKTVCKMSCSITRASMLFHVAQMPRTGSGVAFQQHPQTPDGQPRPRHLSHRKRPFVFVFFLPPFFFPSVSSLHKMLLLSVHDQRFIIQ